jgi:hypothetical protein
MLLPHHVKDAGSDPDGVNDSASTLVSMESRVDPPGRDGRVVPVVVLESSDNVACLVGKDGFVVTLSCNVNSEVRVFLDW